MKLLRFFLFDATSIYGLPPTETFQCSYRTTIKGRGDYSCDKMTTKGRQTGGVKSFFTVSGFVPTVCELNLLESFRKHSLTPEEVMQRFGMEGCAVEGEITPGPDISPTNEAFTVADSPVERDPPKKPRGQLLARFERVLRDNGLLNGNSVLLGEGGGSLAKKKLLDWLESVAEDGSARPPRGVSAKRWRAFLAMAKARGVLAPLLRNKNYGPKIRQFLNVMV